MIYTYAGSRRSGEASCIEHRLPVGKPVEEVRGSLGFYPEYVRITPGQRANYLRWLASGRSAALNDIGYAFLFFYGLERRLLVEREDLSPIVKEVVRLLELYTFSGPFDGYLSRFLSYTLARTGIGTLKEKWFEAVFERSRRQRDEQHVSVGLAWLYKHQRPLPASWALRLARLDPRSPRSVVLERLPDQFGSLFEKRYHEKFGKGLLLRTAKRDREISYTPASPSLLGTLSPQNGLKPVLIPNVMGIQSQFTPLVQIWSSCIEELKPLSRVMVKGAEVATRAAYEALPEDLKAETEHPDKIRWEKLSTEHAQEDGTVLVPVGSIAAIHGIDPRPKLTPKQSESLAATAHDIGFVIEPDFRLTTRSYGWEDLVALFRTDQTPSLPADGRYTGAALMLELGMFIAAADGEIEQEEVDHIATFLESQFLLDPIDARRLEALKHVFLRQHPSVRGLGKRLKEVLNPDQLESIGAFLIGVAAANGSIDKSEIMALRSAYRALGIGSASLDRSLAELERSESEPVEVLALPDSGISGEVIPARPPISLRPAFKLDPALLERLMQETQQVSNLLAEAMQEDEAEEQASLSVEPIPPLPTLDSRFEGLEARHVPVLIELCSRTTWSLGDFELLVRRHSLMPSGALDRINEWAHDRFDDPILEEDGDTLTVQIGLLTENA